MTTAAERPLCCRDCKPPCACPHHFEDPGYPGWDLDAMTLGTLLADLDGIDDCDRASERALMQYAHAVIAAGWRPGREITRQRALEREEIAVLADGLNALYEQRHGRITRGWLPFGYRLRYGEYR